MQPQPVSLQTHRLRLLPTTSSQLNKTCWPIRIEVGPPVVTELESLSLSLTMPKYVGASTVFALEMALRQIESWYTVKEPRAVRKFIQKHPLLVDLLIEAYTPLTDFFGPDPQVSLSVVSDPEEAGLDELVGSIQTPLSPDEALERLDAFDEYWFLDQLNRTNGRLNFNLDFA
jgi:hypothetical protein